MTTNELLYIAFIIYIMIMVLGYLFKIKWLYMVGGLVWFIPVMEIDNLYLTLVCVVIMIVHFMFGFYTPNESEF